MWPVDWYVRHTSVKKCYAAFILAWRFALRMPLVVSWCGVAAMAYHRAASWFQFNCLRSATLGNVVRLLIYWQDAACLVIPEQQVEFAQLYKYHHQSGKATSGKLVTRMTLVLRSHIISFCFCLIFKTRCISSTFCFQLPTWDIITDVEGRFQTSFTTLCNGLTSHGAPIADVWDVETKPNKMRPWLVGVCVCLYCVAFHACLSSCSDRSRCRWHTLLIIKVILMSGMTWIPQLEPMLVKNGVKV